MKQKIPVAKKPVCARIEIPGSKSITNRALLMAALANGVSELSGMLISNDTLAFVKALQNLGVMIQLDERAFSCVVNGCGGQFPKKEAKIECADAGTAARFILAACATSFGTYHFDGSSQLRRRPIKLLLETLCRQGARIMPENAKNMPFTVMGAEGLFGGEIEIDASESGQFVSALLMASPFARSQMTINANDLVSEPFVDMTCAMMRDFGIQVRRLHRSRFSVPVPQCYMARDYVIEPDMTTASYFFAAAAVTGGEVTIQSINLEKSRQGDIKFLTILQQMGCQILAKETGLAVKGPVELQGISVDMRDCSDTFMTLAAIAPFAKSPTTITHIGHTRLQESDRISVMRQQLEKLHVRVEEGPGWIRIWPSTPVGGEIDPHHDHRIAMAFSVLGLRVQNVSINDAECVRKTCPDFFDLWRRIDG